MTFTQPSGPLAARTESGGEPSLWHGSPSWRRLVIAAGLFTALGSAPILLRALYVDPAPSVPAHTATPADQTCSLPAGRIFPDGSGKVIGFLSPAQAQSLLNKTEAELKASINPSYISNPRAVISSQASAQRFVALVPDGMAIVVGDAVRYAGGYRDPTLPCHYVPTLITAIDIPTMVSAEGKPDVPGPRPAPPTTPAELRPAEAPAPVAPPADVASQVAAAAPLTSLPSPNPPQASIIAAVPPPASAAPSTSAPACSIRVPVTAATVSGTVTRFLAPAEAQSMVQFTQQSLQGTINPNYLSQLRVTIAMAGRSVTALVPKGMAVQIGDRVTFNTAHRDASLPCHYIPNLINAVLPKSGEARR